MRVPHGWARDRTRAALRGGAGGRPGRSIVPVLRRLIMYAITGITGQVGGALARALLAAGQPVRAVLRDAAKGAAWAARGCEVALARMDDAAQLAASFAGAEGVFILPPSDFDPAPGYPEARKVID